MDAAPLLASTGEVHARSDMMMELGFLLGRTRPSDISRFVGRFNSSTSAAHAAGESRTLERRRNEEHAARVREINDVMDYFAAANVASNDRHVKETAQTNRISPPVLESDLASFSAGPRARALLRGIDIAAKDLTDSGGSYSLEEVRRLLNGVSRQSVEKRVREGRLLAVVGRNNKRFYPVAQFNDDGSVVDGLRAVQDAMATQNGYAILNFLVNPDPRLDDRKPIDLLKRGEVERVVEAAARIGEQGA
jgi:hypothetical protein